MTYQSRAFKLRPPFFKKFVFAFLKLYKIVIVWCLDNHLVELVDKLNEQMATLERKSEEGQMSRKV